MSNIFKNPSEKVTNIIKVIFYIFSIISIVVGLGIIATGVSYSMPSVTCAGIAVLVIGPLVMYLVTLFYMVMVGAFRDLGRIADAQEKLLSKKCHSQNCEEKDIVSQESEDNK